MDKIVAEYFCYCGCGEAVEVNYEPGATEVLMAPCRKQVAAQPALAAVHLRRSALLDLTPTGPLPILVSDPHGLVTFQMYV